MCVRGRGGEGESEEGGEGEGVDRGVGVSVREWIEELECQ